MESLVELMKLSTPEVHGFRVRNSDPARVPGLCQQKNLDLRGRCVVFGGLSCSDDRKDHFGPAACLSVVVG